jgi:hypothetical protein
MTWTTGAVTHPLALGASGEGDTHTGRRREGGRETYSLFIFFFVAILHHVQESSLHASFSESAFHE